MHLLRRFSIALLPLLDGLLSNFECLPQVSISLLTGILPQLLDIRLAELCDHRGKENRFAIFTDEYHFVGPVLEAGQDLGRPERKGSYLCQYDAALLEVMMAVHFGQLLKQL
jgi:hypothetical protein